jgi:hypothetical protein
VAAEAPTRARRAAIVPGKIAAKLHDSLVGRVLQRNIWLAGGQEKPCDFYQIADDRTALTGY